ncbi:glutathione S-transferase kappa 1-like [Puntigrus tetrazona]|uniref:glutathione S-transferase kappa 1-like n=1 Tax=Puntigrus tetrazona TaxID=1606681 RepID=UPI001C88FD3E|nr:glutathione S-transferase kappa 1-like [Puntigrus tetrazona]
MSSSRKTIELFYDVISPYSWLAFEVLCRYRNVWNIDLKFKPAYLSGIIYSSGNNPPGMNPSKLLYMVSELTLLSQYFGVPMFRPSNISVKDSLNAMRFVTAVAERGREGDTLERLSVELWKRKFHVHQDITQPASLTEAGLKAGLSANQVDEFLTLSNSQLIKDKLKSVTQEAVEKKCFGLPFFVCHMNGKAEVFFGSDKFELMAYFIGEKWMGPYPNKPTSTM